jgi:hypothetical protein
MYATYNQDTCEFEVIGEDLTNIEEYVSQLIEDGTSPSDIEIWERRDDFSVRVRTTIETPETPKQMKK